MKKRVGALMYPQAIVIALSQWLRLFGITCGCQIFCE